MKNINIKATQSIVGGCSRACVEDIVRSPMVRPEIIQPILGGGGNLGGFAGAFGMNHMYVNIWH